MCGKRTRSGLAEFDDLREGDAKAVGRVGFEQIVLDEQDFVELFEASSSAKAATPLPMTRR